MPFVGENCRMQYGNNNIDQNLQLINTIDFFSYTKNWSVEKLLRGIIIYLENTYQLLVHFKYLHS